MLIHSRCCGSVHFDGGDFKWIRTYCARGLQQNGIKVGINAGGGGGAGGAGGGAQIPISDAVPHCKRWKLMLYLALARQVKTASLAAAKFESRGRFGDVCIGAAYSDPRAGYQHRCGYVSRGVAGNRACAVFMGACSFVVREEGMTKVHDDDCTSMRPTCRAAFVPPQVPPPYVSSLLEQVSCTLQLGVFLDDLATKSCNASVQTAEKR